METAAVQTAGNAIGPAVAAGKCICNWLKREYSYVKHISLNFEKLEEENSRLSDKVADVLNELHCNESRKESTVECRGWLRRVKNMQTEIERLKSEYAKIPHTCLCGLWQCPALLKRVVKRTEDAASLKAEWGQITTMCDKAPTVWNDDGWTFYHPPLRNHMDMLIDWLNEEGFKRICIRGPTGVGKTTIMKMVRKKIRESGWFDYIFNVTQKDKSSILRDIQEEILSCLGKKMDKNDPPVRPEVISKTLMGKKYVLFLDELSSAVNFEEVGINHEQGKVVFACRDKYDGCTEKEMDVQVLSKEHARKLFWEVVGPDRDLEKNTAIKQIAEKIIDLCDGMPPILISIGKQLAGKNEIALWREKKSQLQSPKINRDYIIDRWAAEHFLECQRLSKVRDRGHAILDWFTENFLLEKGEKLGHLKMFVGFQRAALRIANEEESQSSLVENGETIEFHKWMQAKRVSLACTQLSSTLPPNPKCSRLSTLLIHENRLPEIPKQFFKYMSGLQVLCLREKGISGLPSSISRLRNLKGLFLDNCSCLVVLPPQIGHLQSLEILDVRHTGIYYLPSEIGQLGNLKCLKVSFTVGNNLTVNSGNCCQKGKDERIIRRKIIKKLSKLEELSIEVSPNSRRWDADADAVAKEITMLKKLTHLHFHFPQMESLDHFIRNSESWKANGETGEFEGFRSFNISVGQQGNSSASDFNAFECSAEKHLKFFAFSAGVEFPGAVSEVLKQATSFELIGHGTAGSLTDGLPDDTLEKLEVCIIEGCDEMTSIIKGNTNTTGGAFRCLKKLHIKKLRNLVSIWKGTIASESFSALTTLTLKECQGITKLFSLEVVRKLCKLQNLQVEDCAMIEKIIEAESSVESTAFPSLKNFQLCSLTSLSSICDVPLECPSLERILIKTCEALTTLPSVLQKAPKLREIQCAEDWWHQQKWPKNETGEQVRTFHLHFC
ncbi:probable disease resistance protein At1g61310 [Durio zibethinus]|uniref:Probable disease resistance protein At1g61310 n=1 Tax=Durio zibethinus TaxID=66656 RepID=A0A6P6A7A2_DURZI|nr:probable disease resistance protein At1g61310 [Durio zibethinus]